MSEDREYSNNVYNAAIETLKSVLKELPFDYTLQAKQDVDRVVEKGKKQSKSLALKKIMQVLNDHGIESIDDIMPQKKETAKKTRAVKYSFEGNEWSGIGREPNWVSQKAQENHM